MTFLKSLLHFSSFHSLFWEDEFVYKANIPTSCSPPSRWLMSSLRSSTNTKIAWKEDRHNNDYFTIFKQKLGCHYTKLPQFIIFLLSSSSLSYLNIACTRNISMSPHTLTHNIQGLNGTRHQTTLEQFFFFNLKFRIKIERYNFISQIINYDINCGSWK